MKLFYEDEKGNMVEYGQTSEGVTEMFEKIDTLERKFDHTNKEHIKFKESVISIFERNDIDIDDIVFENLTMYNHTIFNYVVENDALGYIKRIYEMPPGRRVLPLETIPGDATKGFSILDVINREIVLDEERKINLYAV